MVNAIETASATPAFRKVAECLYRHAPTGIYYGLVQRSGKPFRQSFQTTDRKLAERTLAEFRQKVGRLTRRDNLGKITFAELAAAGIAVPRTKLKRYSSDRLDAGIKPLNRFFGARTVRGITETELREWERRYSSKVSASCFNLLRLILPNVLRHARREGLVMDNPAMSLARRKLPKPNRFIPSHEQFCQLVAQIGEGGCHGVEGSLHCARTLGGGRRVATAERVGAAQFLAGCPAVAQG